VRTKGRWRRIVGYTIRPRLGKQRPGHSPPNVLFDLVLECGHTVTRCWPPGAKVGSGSECNVEGCSGEVKVNMLNESEKGVYAAKQSRRTPEAFRIPEQAVMAIHKAIRVALEEVAHEEMQVAEERIKQRVPDIVASFALRLSQQASFNFGESGGNKLIVEVNLEGLALPQVADLDQVVQELWKAFDADYTPSPGQAQIGAVKAVLRRYGVGR
jgi:hypothetical protein